MKDTFLNNYRLIKGKDSYSNCRIRCIRDFLMLNGINISCEYILLMSLTVFTKFLFIEGYNKLNYSLMLPFDEYFELEVLKLLGFEITELKEDETDSKIKLNQYVLNNEAVIYFFDSYELLHLYTKNSVRIGVISSGIVLGFSDDKLFLNPLAGKEDYVAVSYDDFEQSRRSSIYPAGSKYKAFLPEIDSISKGKIYEKICPLIFERLYSASDQYLKEHTMEVFAENVYCVDGIKAYDYAVDYLEKLLKVVREYKGSPEALNKLFCLELKVFRKGFVSGTSSFSRKEIGEAIVKFSEAIGNKGLAVSGKRLLNVSKKWRELSRLLFSCEKAVSNKEDYLNKVITSLKQTACMEQEIVEGIHATAQKLVNIAIGI